MQLSGRPLAWHSWSPGLNSQHCKKQPTKPTKTKLSQIPRILIPTQNVVVWTESSVLFPLPIIGHLWHFQCFCFWNHFNGLEALTRCFGLQVDSSLSIIGLMLGPRKSRFFFLGQFEWPCGRIADVSRWAYSRDWPDCWLRLKSDMPPSPHIPSHPINVPFGRCSS